MRILFILLFTICASGFLNAQTEEVIIPIDKNAKTQDSSPLFVVVEELPIFKYKDCSSTNESFLRYVTDSLRLPSEDCFGKVYIQFIVEPDSTTGNVKILRGLDNCEGFKEEIERLISTMPKWIPGKQRDVAVRVMMTMPIDFHPNE